MGKETKPKSEEMKERAVLKYLSKTPTLISLFYDANLLPEQLDKQGPTWAMMRGIIIGYRMREMEECLRCTHSFDLGTCTRCGVTWGRLILLGQEEY